VSSRWASAAAWARVKYTSNSMEPWRFSCSTLMRLILPNLLHSTSTRLMGVVCGLTRKMSVEVGIEVLCVDACS